MTTTTISQPSTRVTTRNSKHQRRRVIEKETRRKLFLETLEDRRLLAGLEESVVGAESLVTSHSSHVSDQTSLVVGQSSFTNDQGQMTSDYAQVRRELVIVDAAAPNYMQLLQDVIQNPDGTRRIEAMLIDSNVDGVEVLGQILAQYRDLDAVHIISHGSPGVVRLGNAVLSAETLGQYAGSIRGWSGALNPNADILFYGCDLAGDGAGEQLLATIGELTGADIAASDDVTGSAVRGGDWDLEFKSGSVQTAVAFSSQLQAGWTSTLASVLNLELELMVSPNLVVDSNIETPAGRSPSGAYYAVHVTNTGDAPLTDVYLNFGDYKGGTGDTPGVYPVTASWPGLTGSFSFTHEGGTSDATRYIESIGPGETVTEYWLMSYPLKDSMGKAVFVSQSNPADDLVLKYDVWAAASGGQHVELLDNKATTRNEISAMANKIWPNTTSKVPNEYLVAFDEQLGWRPLPPSADTPARILEGIWYDFGTVRHGFDNNGDFVPDYNAWAQPVGDPSQFDADAYRLVQTYGVLIVKLIDGTEEVHAFRDQLYFQNINPNNNGVVGLVFYDFAPIGVGSVTLTPYQEVASGYDNEKFNADYGTGAGTFAPATPDITFDKTGPTSADRSSTVTYSLSLTNDAPAGGAWPSGCRRSACRR